MKTTINEKLDLLLDPKSEKFNDQSTWNEVFDLVVDLQETAPDLAFEETKRLRDFKNILDDAREEGRREGLAIARKEMAIKITQILKESGVSFDEIIKYTHLQL